MFELSELEQLKVIRRFTGNGHTKSVHLLDREVVKKTYYNHKVFNRELSALQHLQQLDFVPRLYGCNRDSLCIYMSYCGKPLGLSKFVEKQRKIDKMCKKIKRCGLYHNDLKPKNVCKYQGKLYIIDFSWTMETVYTRSRGYTLNSVKDFLSMKR